MEIGRLKYKIRCPKCDECEWTYDPQKKLSTHTNKNTNTECPGSGMEGREIDRKVDPKIK